MNHAVKLSVLMPVYNERASLEIILERVKAVPIDKEILIVDNVSSDGTREFLESLVERGEAGTEDSDEPVRVIFQSVNRGKGSSVRRALGNAKGEWVIVQDADLEYDPDDYLKLFALAEKRKLTTVFGTRLAGAEQRRKQPRTPFFYGRVGLSIFFRVLYGAPLSDVATCYKLMRREFAQSLNLQSDGFDLDFEIAAKVAKKRKSGYLVGETAVYYQPRTEIEGKKIRVVRDGLRAMWALLKFRFLS
jgi:dolichol-phosphate mannosyltransferase